MSSIKTCLLLQLMVHMAEMVFPDFRFRWLSDESKKNLPIELDFYNEGKNCEKVAQLFKHFTFLKVGSSLLVLHNIDLKGLEILLLAKKL